MTPESSHSVHVLPASFAQSRLWFLDRLNPESAAYVTDVPLRVQGPFDADAFARALNDVIARHEVLRTTFTSVDGEAVQVVHRDLAAAVQRLDLRARDDPMAAAAALARELSTTRFDLARGPLIRLTIGRLDDDDWAVLLAVHHIVMDGWSFSVFLDDLRECYIARAAAREPTLTPLPLQYGDFAVWQREQMAAPRLAGQLDYWGERLRAAPRLRLPTDRPRPVLASHRGARERVVLPPSTVVGLREIAREERATMFICLLAGYAVLLRRWSGEPDVVVGTPITGRDQPELERLIGFFVNTLALRLDLHGQPTFRDVVRRTRLAALDAFSHQDLPFERLVSEVAPDRELGHSPFFDTTFALQNTGLPKDWPSLSVTSLAVAHETAKFDLAVTCTEVGDQIMARFAYATDLFDASTVQRMAGHFATLMASAADQPDAAIAGLTMLSEAEQIELVGYNASSMPTPNRCVHELFAERAELQPEACAVEFGDTRLSYRELDERSNRLAGLLQAAGVAADLPVTILLDRTPELVVAELAVWKAGSAFLPLDVAAPPLAILAAVEAAAPSAAITTSAHVGLLPRGLQVILLDRMAQLGALPLPSPPTRDQRSLAYLIATSGTTGIPKLVEIEHRGLVNHLTWIADRVLSDPRPDILAMSSPAFDAAHKQLIGPLLYGGTVWLIPSVDRLDPQRLLAAFASRPRVALNCVPSAWEAILDYAEARGASVPSSLVQLMLGGEQLTAELVDRTFAACPSVALWNLYGPTEATVDALGVQIRRGDSLTIGRPAANAVCEVRDPDGAELPIGVPGELHLGGLGLARGYHRDPIATARAFWTPPAASNERRYRTGDRAVRTADGCIQFLGRLDEQVKVNGVRVELAEIVSHIRRHPEVRDAAVVMREGRLAAYFVPAAEPHAIDLRAHLVPRVHPAAVPGSFTALSGLPLTPAGKLDRAALPDPSSRLTATTSVGVRTTTERCVADIWARLLGREQLGRDDNFFDLGGHSLLLVRAHVQLLTLAPELSVLDLFRYPTLRALAAHIDELASRAPTAQTESA